MASLMHGGLPLHRQAVRARAPFQILTPIRSPIRVSIIVVRDAPLMLVGSHNGVVTCVLIEDAVLWSPPVGALTLQPP